MALYSVFPVVGFYSIFIVQLVYDIINFFFYCGECCQFLLRWYYECVSFQFSVITSYTIPRTVAWAGHYRHSINLSY